MMAGVIDVVGEALVDLVIERDGSVSAALGGAPMNTARTCGRLGLPVRFLGALSVDRFGQLLRDQLIADGVDDGAAVAVSNPTTLAAAEIGDGGAAQFRFYVDGTSAPMVTRADLPDLTDTTATALYTGGLALVLEPMATAVEALVADVAQASQSAGRPSTLVMVDVNCRPLLITDRDAYADRVARVVANAHVVKVSDEDLHYLYPGDDPVDAAQRVRQSGPQVVLVTKGSAGVHVITADAVNVVDVPAATVVDTIGAGDSFSGGFLSWWVDRGLGISDLGSVDAVVAATAAATRVAAIVVGRRGADPPWRGEVASDFSS